MTIVPLSKSPVVEKVKKEKAIKTKMTPELKHYPISNTIIKDSKITLSNGSIPSGNDDRFTDV